MTYAAVFAIVVGSGMIGHWALSCFTKQIPEVKDEPMRIAFHITAEPRRFSWQAASGSSPAAGPVPSRSYEPAGERV